MAGPGRIVQLSVSPGGVPKRAIAEARVTRLGLEGDGHRDPEHHGGPERAVCLFASEVIRALAAEGHAITPGAIGENVTTEGVDWSQVAPASKDARTSRMASASREPAGMTAIDASMAARAVETARLAAISPAAHISP